MTESGWNVNITSKNETNAVVATKLTTILAIDLCGFSTLMEQDETRAIKAVEKLERLIDETAHRLNGRLFHRAGDGFLAEFKTTKEAYLAGQEILKKRREYQIRLGIHVGDVQIQPDGNLLGHTVNIAVRLQETTDPDTLILSRQSYNLISGLDKNTFQSEREVDLKNISKEFVVYEVSRRKLKQERFRDRWKQWAAIPVIFILLIFSARLFLDNSRYENDREKREQLLARALNVQGQQNELDRRYISYLLNDLEVSNIPVGLLKSTLLKVEKIPEAISSLEDSLEHIPVDDPAYLYTLHYIGALSFQEDPPKSQAMYEFILKNHPNDLNATIRLGRILDTQTKVNEARPYYFRAKELTQDQEVLFWLDNDISFNHLLNGEYEKSIAILENLNRQIGGPIAIDSNLASTIEINLAIAYVLHEDLKEAESILVPAIKKQEKLNRFYDLSRSYGVLGDIARKRGKLDPSQSKNSFREAESFYKKKLEIDEKIKKASGIAQASNKLARLAIDRSEFNQANYYADKALLTSKENELTHEEFTSLILLAEIGRRKSDKHQMCDNLLSARALFQIRLGTEPKKIGPETTAIINSMNCSFSFF